ncbi:hypothetical protein B5X24_HaOG213387 [Helicoverpa armigera]|uniref:Uncharacterized protein n=1 Tax=Helicoverpa armigera TaxID=29058 RepID=A0A2W1B7C6_HELAM|nr:hypothetical protein B5X24_HaOG213387 [Helicoverpa armigera]
MNFLENITLRRTKTTVEQNDSRSEFIRPTLAGTTNNTPEISEDEDDKELNILRKEVQNLKTQLKNAHKQIELLSSEICTLKQANSNPIKNNELIQEAHKVPTNAPQKTKTPKRSKTKKWTPDNKQATTEQIPVQQIGKNQSSFSEDAILEANVLQVDESLLLPVHTSSNEKASATQRSVKVNNLHQNKLCIISDNNVNNILHHAEITFPNKKICPYCIPKAVYQQS